MVFNAPVRQILGFPGSAEQRIAIERGELDGDCGSYSSIPVEWIRDGKVHPFVRFVDKKPPEIPDSAVFINTFAKTDEQQQLLDVLNGADVVGRPFIMSQAGAGRSRCDPAQGLHRHDEAIPPSSPRWKSPSFPLNPMTGEDAEAVVTKMMNVPTNVVAKAKEIYE